MLCRSPVRLANGWFVPCGTCLQCRIGQRRLWADRIQLETSQHASSVFVTLTYAPEKEPAGQTLVPADLRDWLKRIRERVEPLRLRYFAVGEYGSTTFRPHYHVALFGYSYCSRGTSHFNRSGSCCPHCDLLLETWGHGFVHSSPLSEPQARYIAGYVTKKLERPTELAGREPEFARMSRRPGLGAWMAPAIAETLTRYVRVDDAPSALRVGKNQHLLLGRYMRRLIRRELGLPENSPPEKVEEFAQKMLALQSYADQIGVPAKKILVDLSGNRPLRLEFFEKLRKKNAL